jgi:hypothetical protein
MRGTRRLTLLPLLLAHADCATSRRGQRTAQKCGHGRFAVPDANAPFFSWCLAMYRKSAALPMATTASRAAVRRARLCRSAKTLHVRQRRCTLHDVRMRAHMRACPPASGSPPSGSRFRAPAARRHRSSKPPDPLSTAQRNDEVTATAHASPAPDCTAARCEPATKEFRRRVQ